MKILHLSAQKPDSTGSGVYLSETVASLSRLGCEQAVIIGIAPEDDPRFDADVLLRPVRFETPELPFPVVGMSNVMPYRATRYADLTPEMTDQFKAAFTAAIDDVLDRFTPDVIICHHLYLLCAVMAQRVAERKQVDPALAPCVVCGLSHSTDMRQMLQIPLERDFIRSGVCALDYALALHDTQAAEIVDVYGIDPSRVRVVGTGYNANVFNRKAGLRKAGTAKVVYVGKIYRKKGVESLLHAFETVVANVPNADLTLVGGYNDEQEYNEIVKLAQDRNLPALFAGRLSQDELVTVYNEADVFVLPSFFEGLPLVAVEALACGCKVVITDLPGLQPWLSTNVDGDAVTYVEPPRMRNVDTPYDEDLPAFEERLADALVRALKAPAVQADTSRASWDALAERLLNAAMRRAQ